MAVYTPVSEEDLRAFLAHYDIGDLVRFEGIEQGVSNTNYHLFTDRGRYILTLFEPHRVHEEDIPAYVEYAIALEKNGVPCPQTLVQKNGKTLERLSNRPTVIYSFLQGEGGTVAMLNPDLCEKAGAVLAKMHKAAEQSIEKTVLNHFGIARWTLWVTQMGYDMDQILPGLHDMAQHELFWFNQRNFSDLPRGAIHADYFPDNVFFSNNAVAGVIDFHFVCDDLFVYDLGIAINAWSFDEKNEFRKDRMDAFMKGYESVRPLSLQERDALPAMLRAGALRFLLSRAEEKLRWREGDFMTPHDPLVYVHRLRHFQEYTV
jgi:homoserine kinase type II